MKYKTYKAILFTLIFLVCSRRTLNTVKKKIPLSPYTLQVQVFVEWSSHQECAVVQSNFIYLLKNTV